MLTRSARKRRGRASPLPIHSRLSFGSGGCGGGVSHVERGDKGKGSKGGGTVGRGAEAELKKAAEPSSRRRRASPSPPPFLSTGPGEPTHEVVVPRYTCTHNTLPEGEYVSTDRTNILIRTLTIKEALKRSAIEVAAEATKRRRSGGFGASFRVFGTEGGGEGEGEGVEGEGEGEGKEEPRARLKRPLDLFLERSGGRGGGGSSSEMSSLAGTPRGAAGAAASASSAAAASEHPEGPRRKRTRRDGSGGSGAAAAAAAAAVAAAAAAAAAR